MAPWLVAISFNWLPAMTMNHSPWITTLTAALLLVGCALPAPPPNDPSLSAEQIVRRLNGKKLSSMRESDPIFALADLRSFLHPAAERCRADGGDFVVVSRTYIQFAAKTTAAGLSQTRLYLPERLACRSSASFLWGASLTYGEPMFFPSQWAGEVYYYANPQLGFISGASLERTEPTSAANRDADRKRNEECSALRMAYTQRIRANPQIGMTVGYGAIIDLKPPIALIQYDALGRQLKGREQEWVQISSLTAGSDCPT